MGWGREKEEAGGGGWIEWCNLRPVVRIGASERCCTLLTREGSLQQRQVRAPSDGFDRAASVKSLFAPFCN